MAGLIAKGAEKMMVWAKVKVSAVVLVLAIGAIYGVMVAAESQTLVASSPTTAAVAPSKDRQGVLRYKALSDTERKLLSELLAVRATTISASGSGRGTGSISVQRTSPQFGAESEGPSKVEFIFSGNNGIRWETDFKSGVLARSYLTKDGKYVVHGPKVGIAPAFVSVDPKPGHMLGGAPLGNWTFAEISRIPLNMRDWPEKEMFDIGETRMAMSLQSKGHFIEVKGVVGNERKPPEAKDYKATVVCIFDMDLGGMLTEFSEQRETVREDGSKEIWEQGVSVEWASVNGRIVPQKWASRGRTRDPNGDKYDSGCVVEFATFRIEPVLAAELDMSQLRIKPGTPVVDPASGVEYRYTVDGETTTKAGR